MEKIKSLQVKANQSPEAIARDLLDRYTKWEQAGIEKATADAMIDSGYTVSQRESYLQAIVDANTPIFAEALYGPEWGKNTSATNGVAANIAGEKILSKELLSYHLTTSGDPHPYTSHYEFNAVTPVVDMGNGDYVLNLDATVRDNMADNPRLASLGATNHEGERQHIRIEYNIVNESIIISSIHTSAR